MKKITQDLYTTTDVKKVRESLVKEQNGLDPVTRLPLQTPCLDHKHDLESLVRGVLSRQVNAYVGKLENNYKMYIGYWCSIPLPELLRNIADYLEKPEDTRYRHTGWLKKVQTEFNKLSAGEQNEVLKVLSGKTGKNPKERKELFRKTLLTREHTFDSILKVLQQKEE
jgi:hypothetical protein